jgi:hypothetical protein
MEWMKNMDELDRGSPVAESVAGSQRGRQGKLLKECGRSGEFRCRVFHQTSTQSGLLLTEYGPLPRC